MRFKKTLGLVALLLAGSALALQSCSTTHPRRNPMGETFPTVQGTSLKGEAIELPTVGAGAPMLLLLGFDQDAQFDIDRWLFGITDAGLKVRAYEVPTIPGMIPRMLSGTIDGGMRRGIPKEDWGGVVTVYGDGEKIAKFTGNEDGLTGRALLLDGAGKVVYFHDRGYSVGSLQKLQAALEQTKGAPAR